MQRGEAVDPKLGVEAEIGVVLEMAEGLGGVMDAVFSRFALAEKLLLERWPNREDEPDGIMGHLFVRPGIRGSTGRLYMAHVRELIERAPASDQEMLDTTDAEVLYAFMRMSLEAPLNSGGYAVYWHLFQKLFPDEAARMPDGEAREDWEGQIQESIDESKRQIRSANKASPRPDVG